MRKFSFESMDLYSKGKMIHTSGGLLRVLTGGLEEECCRLIAAAMRILTVSLQATSQNAVP